MFKKITVTTGLFFLGLFSSISAENLIYNEVTSHNDNSIFISGKETEIIYTFDEEAANNANAWLVVMLNIQRLI